MSSPKQNDEHWMMTHVRQYWQVMSSSDSMVTTQKTNRWERRMEEVQKKMVSYTPAVTRLLLIINNQNTDFVDDHFCGQDPWHLLPAYTSLCAGKVGRTIEMAEFPVFNTEGHTTLNLTIQFTFNQNQGSVELCHVLDAWSDTIIALT